MPIDAAEKQAVMQYHLAQTAHLPVEDYLKQQQIQNEFKDKETALGLREQIANMEHGDKVAALNQSLSTKVQELSLKTSEYLHKLDQDEKTMTTNKQKLSLEQHKAEITGLKSELQQIEVTWKSSSTMKVMPDGTIQSTGGGVDIASMRNAFHNPEDPNHERAIVDYPRYITAMDRLNKLVNPQAAKDTKSNSSTGSSAGPPTNYKFYGYKDGQPVYTSDDGTKAWYNGKIVNIKR